MLKWQTAGESHGPALVALMEGVPSGISVTTEQIKDALAERREGYGRGARQKFEQDHIEILGGLRHGKTTGAPIAITIRNSEWPKWEHVMSADPVEPEKLMVDAGKGDPRESARNKKLTSPRPGHADYAGMLSYRLDDARDVLERASARETAARVALGAIAKQILQQVSGTTVVGHVVAVGPASAQNRALPGPDKRDALRASPTRTLDSDADIAFQNVIDEAKRGGDTIGGIVEVVAWNVPVGLGSHVESERKLDARLAGELMSIQSAKAVEIGAGLASAATPGSSAHDEMAREGTAVVRLTNRAGGIEGGTSNGMPIIARVAFKPISTVPRALTSVDLATGETTRAFHQRSDTSQVVPAATIAEASVALVLAESLLERFGGHSLEEVRAQYLLQEDYVRQRTNVQASGDPTNDGKGAARA